MNISRRALFTQSIVEACKIRPSPISQHSLLSTEYLSNKIARKKSEFHFNVALSKEGAPNGRLFFAPSRAEQASSIH